MKVVNDNVDKRYHLKAKILESYSLLFIEDIISVQTRNAIEVKIHSSEEFDLVENSWLDTRKGFIRKEKDLMVMRDGETEMEMVVRDLYKSQQNPTLLRKSRLFIVYNKMLTKIMVTSFDMDSSPVVIFIDRGSEIKQETNLGSQFTEVTGIELDYYQRVCIVVGSKKKEEGRILALGFDPSARVVAQFSKHSEVFKRVKRVPGTNTLLVAGKNIIYTLFFDNQRNSFECLAEIKIEDYFEIQDMVYYEKWMMVVVEGKKKIYYLKAPPLSVTYNFKESVVHEKGMLGALPSESVTIDPRHLEEKIGSKRREEVGRDLRRSWETGNLKF